MMVKLLIIGAISFVLCGCCNLQIGLFNINNPAGVRVATEDEVEVETEAEIDIDKSKGKTPQINNSLY